MSSGGRRAARRYVDSWRHSRFPVRRQLVKGVSALCFLGFYSLPRVALAPLMILWFGIGSLSKIMMAFSMVVFVVIFFNIFLCFFNVFFFYLFF